MSAAPFVSVLIPARNEAADIPGCIAAVLAQDHPHDRMEIIVVDGGSADGTLAAAHDALRAGDIAWRTIENPVGTTPSNLNLGLKAVSGEVVCRVDARSILPPSYVRLCASTLLSRPEIAVTGGAQVALPRDDTPRSLGIARALNNRFAMGGARYRSGAESGPTDTVYLGAFRTEDLRAVGGWDETMLTNQDYELNRRMGRQGTVYFDSRLEVGYLPRVTVASVWQQYHRFGRWKVRYWRRTGDRPRPRQYAALSLVPACVFVLAAAAIRRDGSAIRLAAAGLLGFLWLEERGATNPTRRLLVRAHACATLVAVALGWTSGVVREGAASATGGRSGPRRRGPEGSDLPEGRMKGDLVLEETDAGEL